MAFLSPQSLSTAGAGGSQSNAMKHLHVVTNDAGLTNDGARAVVEEKMTPDSGSWMDIGTGTRMSPFAHDSRQKRDAASMKLVGQPMDSDGFDKGIGDDDFLAGAGSGVALKGGINVGLE